MWNVFESMENTNQQTELSLVEKWNSLCNLLTWIIWSTCCVKLCIVWPRNNDYIASVQCLLPESTLKACTVLTNFENFGFLFPMALVCSVPCSCDRQSNWNLDWKFMFPLVRNQFLIMLSFIFNCYWICLVSCPAQWSTINQLVLWLEVRFLLPLHSVVTNTRHFYFWFLYGYFYVCAIDFNLQCGLSTIIFSRVIIV